MQTSMGQDIDLYDLLGSVQPMPLDEFWAIIDQVNDIHATEKLPKDEALGQLLAPRPATEAARYFKCFCYLFKKLGNDEVYAVLGGSDDGFPDVRAWAISMGQAYCEQLLNSPQSLVGTRTEAFEEFAYVPSYSTEAGAKREKYLAAGLARLEAATLRAQIPKASPNPHGPALRV